MDWELDTLALRSRNRLSLAVPGFADSTAAEIPFTVLVGASRRPAALLMAGVHGDEYEGPAAIQDLCAELEPAALGGTVILVPVANPFAFRAATRRNPVDLADLNRSFPGDPRGTCTERLAHLLCHGFALPSECILSLHGWSKEAVVVPYAEYPEGTDDTAGRSAEAARSLGLRYVHPYRWPAGVLGETTTAHGIPTVETEVGGMGTVTREGQAIYREVILRFLGHFGILPWTGSEPAETTVIGHTDFMANHAGLFRSEAAIGEAVAEGQMLGTIRGLGGECLETIRASHAGVVGILRMLASVAPGDRLVQLFREVR